MAQKIRRNQVQFILKRVNTLLITNNFTKVNLKIILISVYKTHRLRKTLAMIMVFTAEKNKF